MVEYKCNKCHKIFTKKYNYEHHLIRKFSCTTAPINTECVPDDLINKKNELNNQNNDKQCNYCNKTFSQVSSLNRHLNNRCSVKMNDINEKENMYQKLLNEINALKIENLQQKKEFAQQISDLKEQIKNNVSINNGTINNIGKQQNNITNNVYINLVAHENFQSVYFDKNIPENMYI